MEVYNNVDDYEAKKALKNAMAAELAVGVKVAKLINSALKNNIRSSFESISSNSDLMQLSRVYSRPGQDGLKDIVVTSPMSKNKTKDPKSKTTGRKRAYGFILNYGFEGVKSNGQFMRLKPADHLHNAIERTNALNILADELTAIKGDKIIATLNFRTHGL